MDSISYIPDIVYFQPWGNTHKFSRKTTEEIIESKKQNLDFSNRFFLVNVSYQNKPSPKLL